MRGQRGLHWGVSRPLPLRSLPTEPSPPLLPTTCPAPLEDGFCPETGATQDATPLADSCSGMGTPGTLCHATRPCHYGWRGEGTEGSLPRCPHAAHHLRPIPVSVSLWATCSREDCGVSGPLCGQGHIQGLCQGPRRLPGSGKWAEDRGLAGPMGLGVSEQCPRGPWSHLTAPVLLGRLAQSPRLPPGKVLLLLPAAFRDSAL